MIMSTLRLIGYALMMICTIKVFFVCIDLFLPSDKGYNDFNTDYQIDLQEEGYLVKDEKGTVHYVPTDKLEEWFLNDNL